jgi:hypothetical protein
MDTRKSAVFAVMVLPSAAPKTYQRAALPPAYDLLRRSAPRSETRRAAEWRKGSPAIDREDES